MSIQEIANFLVEWEYNEDTYLDVTYAALSLFKKDKDCLYAYANSYSCLLYTSPDFKPIIPDDGGHFVGSGDDWGYIKPDGSQAKDEWVSSGGDWYYICLLYTSRCV